MSDPKLVKSWKNTEALLERARHALPISHEQECAALLTRYCEFLEHNELELALDILEEKWVISSLLVAGFGVIWSEPPKTWA